VDDDPQVQGDVESGLGQEAHVVVRQHGRDLGALARVQEQLGVDLLRRRRQHVQVVEGTLVSEAAQVAVANHFLITFLAVMTENRN